MQREQEREKEKEREEKSFEGEKERKIFIAPQLCKRLSRSFFGLHAQEGGKINMLGRKRERERERKKRERIEGRDWERNGKP